MVENVANVVFGPLSTKFQSLRRRMDIYCTYILSFHIEKHGSTNQTSKTIAEEGKEPIPKRGETV